MAKVSKHMKGKVMDGTTRTTLHVILLCFIKTTALWSTHNTPEIINSLTNLQIYYNNIFKVFPIWFHHAGDNNLNFKDKLKSTSE